MPISISAEQMRWFRLRRSGLIDPLASAEEAARALFGVQAQILPAAALALWNRSTALTEQGLDDLLYTRRTLVKLWGQRGTLHLYASDDWPLLHAARSINRTWWERQLGQADVAGHEALIEAVADLLLQHESVGRSHLRAANLPLNDEHFSAWGGIFADLVRRGYACHAERIGNEGRFAHRQRWLPNLIWEPPDAQTANIAVLRRFWAAYGPAALQDFTYWRSAQAVQARRWQQIMADELAEATVEGQPMMALRCDLELLTATPPPADEWPVRMLYRFDPLILAHKDKAWVADSADYKRIWRPAGHIEGIVLAHGRAVATWRYERKSVGLAIILAPFAPLPSYVNQAIAKIAPQIASFFALPLADINLLRRSDGNP